MADLKISGLTTTEGIQSTDLVEFARDAGGGVFASRKGTMAATTTYLQGNIRALDQSSRDTLGTTVALSLRTDAGTAADAVALDYVAHNDAQADTIYARSLASIVDPTAASEIGKWELFVMTGGTLTEALQFVGTAATFAGTINGNNVGTTGSPTFAGLTVNGNIDLSSGNRSLLIPDNSAAAFQVEQGGNVYMRFVSTNSAESVKFEKSVIVLSDLTFAAGSITSESSAISFGNENLSTTGTLAAGPTTVTGALTANNAPVGLVSARRSAVTSSGVLHSKFGLGLSSSADNAYIGLYRDDGANNGSIAFAPSSGGTATERAWLRPGGKLEVEAGVIGTTANGYLDLFGDSGATLGVRISDAGNLTVSGTGNSTFAGRVLVGTTSLTDNGAEALRVLGVSQNVVQNIHGTGSGFTYCQWTNDTTGTDADDGFAVGLGGDESAVLWNYEATAMRFATNNTERARIGATTGNFMLGGTTEADSATKSLHMYNTGVAPTAGVADGVVWYCDDVTTAEAFVMNEAGVANQLSGNAKIRGSLSQENATTGQALNIKQASTLLSGLSGATATATDLIPAGALVVSVTIRVTTLIEGATTFDVGDGTDVDAWGAAIALTAGTTTTLADATVTTANIYPSLTSVVLTANGANFTAGAVRVTVHYIDVTAATA